MGKRILIVCKYFYPQLNPRSFRATELAKEFTRLGHEVVVCLPYQGFDTERLESLFHLIIWNLGEPKFKGIEICGNRLKTTFLRVYRKVLEVLFEYPDISLMHMVSNRLANAKGFDLLISIAVPHPIHWGVALAYQKHNDIAKVWIADCGDPFMLGKLTKFRKPFYFKYFEKKFCKECTYISVPFPEMGRQFYPEFKNKIITIPQGFIIKGAKGHNHRVNNEYPTFIFAGTIIPGIRDLTQLLNFLLGFNGIFRFIIYTSQRTLFGKYVELLANKLEIRDYIPRDNLIIEMGKVDFLVNVDSILDNTTNVEAIPSKLIDYSIAGRPILNISMNNFESDKVMAFLAGDYSQARKIDISKYDIEVVSNLFLSKCE